MTNNYWSRKITATLFILILLVGVSSCGSKKISMVDGSGTLKAKSHDEVVEDVLSHELDYKTITTKGKVSLNGKEVTTIFKLVKDDIIQASIRPILGIEAMRVDITPTKATLIDRLGSRYAEVDLNDPQLEHLVAFNFYNLQSLLTNQLFLAGNKKVDKTNYKDYKINASKDHYILKADDKNDLKYSFSVDASNRIVSTLINSEPREMSLLWSYDQFVADKEHIYPTKMMADIKLMKKKFKVAITYSNLDVNTSFNVDRSISSRYKKVDIREIIEGYMKLK